MINVSILMGAYNCEATVEGSLRSVLSQTCEGLEVVVVNDGSTDATLSILTQLARQDRRLKVVNLEQNVGLTRALNIGLQHCSGLFVARQDADDLSLPDRFSGQFEFALKNSADFVVSRFRRGGVVKPHYFRRFITRRSLRFGNFLCHGTFFMRRSVLIELGGYDEAWPVAQDYELLLRWINRGKKITYNRDVVYDFIYNEKSISARKAAKQIEYSRRALTAHLGSDHSFAENVGVFSRILRSFGV